MTHHIPVSTRGQSASKRRESSQEAGPAGIASPDGILNCTQDTLHFFRGPGTNGLKIPPCIRTLPTCENVTHSLCDECREGQGPCHRESSVPLGIRCVATYVIRFEACPPSLLFLSTSASVLTMVFPRQWHPSTRTMRYLPHTGIFPWMYHVSCHAQV